MKIKPSFALIISLAVVLASGCSSMLRPKAPETAFYRLEYKTVPVNCSESFAGGVSILAFTTAAPYDRNQMVVLTQDRQVIFSQNYQWVALPGTMLTNHIRNDLQADRLFSMGVQTGLENTLWQLSGRVAEFACQRSGDSCEAILEVAVNLEKTGAGDKDGFQKTYRLKSAPFNKQNSALFASAMSKVVGQFSEQLRRDLCAFEQK